MHVPSFALSAQCRPTISNCLLCADRIPSPAPTLINWLLWPAFVCTGMSPTFKTSILRCPSLACITSHVLSQFKPVLISLPRILKISCTKDKQIPAQVTEYAFHLGGFLVITANFLTRVKRVIALFILVVTQLNLVITHFDLSL